MLRTAFPLLVALAFSFLAFQGKSLSFDGPAIPPLVLLHKDQTATPTYYISQFNQSSGLRGRPTSIPPIGPNGNPPSPFPAGPLCGISNTFFNESDYAVTTKVQAWNARQGLYWPTYAMYLFSYVGKNALFDLAIDPKIGVFFGNVLDFNKDPINPRHTLVYSSKLFQFLTDIPFPSNAPKAEDSKLYSFYRFALGSQITLFSLENDDSPTYLSPQFLHINFKSKSATMRTLDFEGNNKDLALYYIVSDESGVDLAYAIVYDRSVGKYGVSVISCDDGASQCVFSNLTITFSKADALADSITGAKAAFDSQRRELYVPFSSANGQVMKQFAVFNVDSKTEVRRFKLPDDQQDYYSMSLCQV